MFRILQNAIVILIVLLYSCSNKQNYLTLIRNGKTFLDSQDYEKALDFFNNAIEQKPEYGETFFYRGLSKYYLENFDGTIKDFKKTLELDSINFQKTRKLFSIDNQKNNFDYPNSFIYLQYRAYCGIYSDDLKKYIDTIIAIKESTKTINLNPDSMLLYYKRGIARDYFNDYRGAIKDYSKAIELNPNNADAYYKRAIAKRYLNRYYYKKKDYITDYTKAIELNHPKSSQIYNERGFGLFFDFYPPYINEKECNNAIEYFSKGIDLYPKEACLYFSRGLAAYSLKKYKFALINFDSVTNIEPDFANAYFYSGLVKYDLENYKEAIKYFTEAIKRDTCVKVYIQRGLARYKFYKKKHYNSYYIEACIDFWKALEIDDGYDEENIKKYIKKYCCDCD